MGGGSSSTHPCTKAGREGVAAHTTDLVSGVLNSGDRTKNVGGATTEYLA